VNDANNKNVVIGVIAEKKLGSLCANQKSATARVSSESVQDYIWLDLRGGREGGEKRFVAVHVARVTCVAKAVEQFTNTVAMCEYECE
jgi:hypothetical protein